MTGEFMRTFWETAARSNARRHAGESDPERGRGIAGGRSVRGGAPLGPLTTYC
jgi:hypothetical protein